MPNQSDSKPLFDTGEHSFVSILTEGAQGGRPALRDYLQMRSSQLVRHMRRMRSDSQDHERIRQALMAMSEASRLIDLLEEPASPGAPNSLAATTR